MATETKNRHLVKRTSISCFIVIISIIILTPTAPAVSQSALMFLRMSPSPVANSMGGTYSNAASIDPMASIFNPAYLGFYSQKHNFGFSYSKTDWLPQLASGMDYSCISLNFGLAMKKIPISFGLGYHRILLNMGEQVYTAEHTDEFGNPIVLGTFESWDKAQLLSLSAACDYYIRASIGFSFKFIESKLGPVGAGAEQGAGKASVNAYDFGVAVQAPIFEMISKVTHRSLSMTPYVRPFLEPGFSYSVTNIGDKVAYVDAAQSDPLPRTVFAGIHISSGLRYSKNDYDFNIVSFKWAREANDLLVERNRDGDYKYLSGLNDIHFIDNIIVGNSNTNIIMNRGWEINLGDVFFLRSGHYENIEAKDIYDAEGLGVNFVQPVRLTLKLMNIKIENDVLRKIVYNLDIEYHSGEYDYVQGSPLTDNKFNCFVFKLGNVFEL